MKILHLIRILLIYGICHEYGSWQVLVDTLALIHLHICEERSTCLKEKQEVSGIFYLFLFYIFLSTYYK